MSLQLPVQLDNKPEVGELYIGLKNLTNWKRFAFTLRGIDFSHVEEINENEKKITDCKNDLYIKWLRVCSDAKWSDVVTALRAIDEHALADTLTGSTGGTSHTHSTTDTPMEEGVTRGTHPTGIYLYHGITQQLQTTGTITNPQMTQKMINFPTTTEKETEIVEQLEELKESFTELLQNVRAHIENFEITDQNALYKVVVNIEIADLDDRLANISQCQTAAEIWKIIQNVSNFLHGR